MVPEPELRKATIPIFFDMMQCEYNFSGNRNFHMVREPHMLRANVLQCALGKKEKRIFEQNPTNQKKTNLPKTQTKKQTTKYTNIVLNTFEVIIKWFYLACL